MFGGCQEKMVRFLIILICLVFSSWAQASDMREALEQSGANVVFMRHALAPGYGDPDNFKVGDCSTQRNLNDAGRRQAAAIGREFRNNNIVFDRILSSQWCRCQETAHYLGIGAWAEFTGLNSFFQGYADKQQTVQFLEEKLSTIPLDHLVLMVTHQVVISEITGYAPASGGLIFYNTQSKKAGEW